MIRISLMAAVALALAAPAMAEPFTLFIHETPEDLALRGATSGDGAAYWALWADYATVLGGAVRGGAPLLIEAADGVTLSGYFILETTDRAEAEALAALAPSVVRGGDAVIVPHLAMPDMPGMSD